MSGEELLLASVLGDASVRSAVERELDRRGRGRPPRPDGHPRRRHGAIPPVLVTAGGRRVVLAA